MRASGASRCSRSSSPSARSCRGPSRTPARSRRRRTPIRATGPTGWRSCGRGSRPRRSSAGSPRPTTAATERQVGVVDAQGRAATYTGSGCHDWAGGRTGEGYAAQGNILVSAATVDALAETFEAATGSLGAAPARVARGRPGRRRRLARTAIGRAARRRAGRRLRRPLRRPRRPARRRPRAADRGAAPAARPPRHAVRQVGRGRADRHRRGAQARARPSGSRGSATSGSRTGPASRTSRSESRARAGSTRSSCTS